MRFDYEEFINSEFCILTSSPEELETIKSYYKIVAGTVNRDNLAAYPYIFANKQGVHGSALGYSIKRNVTFQDWARMVFHTEPDCELEESDHDISFLVE